MPVCTAAADWISSQVRTVQTLGLRHRSQPSVVLSGRLNISNIFRVTQTSLVRNCLFVRSLISVSDRVDKIEY